MAMFSFGKKKAKEFSFLDKERLHIASQIGVIQEEIQKLDSFRQLCAETVSAEEFRETTLAANFLVFKAVPFMHPIRKRDFQTRCSELQQSVTIFEKAVGKLAGSAQLSADLSATLKSLHDAIDAFLESVHVSPAN